MRSPEATAFLDSLFQGLSEGRMRHIGLEAVKQCATRCTGDALMPMILRGRWYREVLAILSPGTRVEDFRPGAIQLKEFEGWHPEPGDNNCARRFDVLPLAFLEWLVTAGLAVPLNPHWLVLTESGFRLASGDHPLRAGTIDKLRVSCRPLFEDSLNRIEDAQACLEKALPRPAMILLGLAYEELVTVVLRSLNPKKANGMAAARQQALRKLIEGQAAGDAREKALNALNVADSIREARNSAAHVAAGDWEMGEVEALIFNGILAFPKLATCVAAP